MGSDNLGIAGGSELYFCGAFRALAPSSSRGPVAIFHEIGMRGGNTFHVGMEKLVDRGPARPDGK